VHRLPAIAVVLVAVMATAARADNSTWQFTLSGDLAPTDNVFAVPESDNPQADVFVEVRPGVLWAYDSPRAMQELSAQLDLVEYALHSTDLSATGYGNWKGFFLPGPRSEALLTADASAGELNAISSRSNFDAPPPGLVPDTTKPITVYQGDASAYLSWIAAKDWRLYVNGVAQYLGTDDNEPMPTITYAGLAGINLGLQREFRSNSLSLEVGGQWVYLERVAPVGALPGTGDLLSRQLNPRGLAIWRHDIDKHWSTNLTGGVVYLYPYAHDPVDPMDLNKPSIYPTASALLGYSQPWGRATLTVSHVIAPNLLVAENVMDDQAMGQVALPLPWLDDNPHLRTPKLAALGMVSFERTELLDAATSAQEGRFDIFRLSAGVSYSPHPGRTYGLRYEFIYQRPTDSIGALLAPAFFRDTLYFTFDLRFPDRVAVAIPRINSIRADGKDLAPVGAEPVVPDPLEQLDDSGGQPQDR
jgi:hypothetical protein